ncbi:cytochrome P450 [Hysterangium stoloniferum]|nr:cytochrome P450 [Hysterangium stoloniferum]
MYYPYLTVPCVAFLLVLRLLIRHLRRHSIAYLPGPKSESWLVGIMPDLIRPKEVGDADIAWTNEYGTALRIKGTFNQDVLFLSDPKGLKHILNSATSNFSKIASNRALATIVTGRGLSWAEGAQHVRQRKVLNPAFSFASLRGFLPIFRHTAQRVSIMSYLDISQSGEVSTVVDIVPWMSRVTLDAIGAAVFDHQFGAIDQLEGEDNLSKAYKNIFTDAFLDRPDSMIVFESILGIVPEWLSSLLLSAPSARLKRLHSYMTIARGIAKDLVDRETTSHINGKAHSKDTMSLLVRANIATDPKENLSEDEVLSQLTTMFLAGHQSIAATLTWALYELSRHLEYQALVREEIKAIKEQISQRGNNEITIADLDTMKYMLALIKETLRFHCIVPGLPRDAMRDDIIPLTKPVKTESGRLISSITISRGQRVFISFIAYHRLKAIWGEDADQWRPERFLEDDIVDMQNITLGLLSNIATFSSGPRGCIGWRFAILEMQSVMIEILENFELSPPPGNVEILRVATGFMAPIIRTRLESGLSMPISLSPCLF